MLAVLVITAVAVVSARVRSTNRPRATRFAAMFALDTFAIFFKLLFIVVDRAGHVCSRDDFLREARYSAWEYYSLLGFALCGMIFMASGVHLISI